VALSPSIPTSFVPKQPVSTGRRTYASEGNNIFLLIATGVLLLTVIASGGMYFYGKILQNEIATKQSQLVDAEKKADPVLVTDYVRLQDRLTTASSLLNQHIRLSNFLLFLGTITGQNISFNNVTIGVTDDQSATLALAGTAKTFNALESESAIFATQKSIKSAIFSGIAPQKGGGVTFTINATIDPSVITENALTSSLPALPVSTKITPATSAATSTAATTIISTASSTATSTKP
jgi:hypothetical protein